MGDEPMESEDYRRGYNAAKWALRDEIFKLKQKHDAEIFELNCHLQAVQRQQGLRES